MINKNNLTLLVDANWLLISRASVLIKSFRSDLPEEAKKQAQAELEDLLAKSICVILNKLPSIDNLVIVADGGSWRKQLPIPSCIEGTTYKGNRTKTDETDWNYIYKALSNVLDKAKEENITVSQYNNIEGDDWAWYWSRRLNNEGTNCVIWTSDNDLKQLVQIDEKTNAFTAWYNDKNGLWLPEIIDDRDRWITCNNDDCIDFFMNVQYYSPVLESIKIKINSINYINPDSIVMSKVICGDAGDNILPIARYNKNDRTYTVTSLEEVEKIMNEKPGFVNAHWCGSEECELKMKEIRGTKSRCIMEGHKHIDDKCVVCGKEAKELVVWGIQY